jgi:ABC-type multidrug transport system fused ATPase/permease subunit
MNAGVPGNVPDLLIQLWRSLSGRRRRQFLLLAGLILISALAEMISLSTVLPFIGIIAKPDWVFSRPLFARVLQAWGLTSAAQLVLPMTLAFVVTVLLAAIIRTLLLWTSTRLASETGAELSIEVYRRTLYQPYQVHVARNSSEVISGITNKIHGVVFGVLLPLLTLVSSTVLLAAITLTLVVINPLVNSSVIFGFGLVYGSIGFLSRRRLRGNSKRVAYEHTQAVKALQEGLGGIRDVLLDGAQPIYCQVYHRADSTLRRAEGNNYFIGQSPRFAMEALGMMLIAGLTFFLSRQAGGISAALPMLAALALGAQRLLPALQQCHGSWSDILGHQASLADIVKLLAQPIPAELVGPAPAPLVFRDSIRFDAVRFRYVDEGPWVIDDFTLTINKGSRCGFVGSTGSGKSTMMDLLMALLLPSEGKLLIDGRVLSGDRIRAWQRTIAHVPQSIFLADTTLAENIAFGVPRDAIDLARVRQAARRAQISDFIESRSEGYDAIVGERGVRLSGGQRQRIGIARALYKEATVIVLDEATSALDSSTERSVMDAIDALSRDLTVLIIAHRLTTVERCDTIVELKQGRVTAQGRYEDLLEQSPSFRKMAYGARFPDEHRAQNI